MKIGTDIIWLSEKDVKDLLPMSEALVAVEEAFRLHGTGQMEMPPKSYINFPEFNGDLRAMPAYLKGNFNLAGVKVVNSHSKNFEKGLAAVQAVLILNDPETGYPLALMSAGHLTGIRTGAAGGVAAKYLARKNSSRVGLVGCGRQAETQLEALRHFFNIKEIFAWGAIPGEAEKFCKRVINEEKIKILPVLDVKLACDADIVITSTPVKKPIVQAGWIQPGTHINAIGADAPGKQELDIKILKTARIFVDDKVQSSHAGEINMGITEGLYSLDLIAGELGEVVAGKIPGRTSDQEITIFDSTGLALQDVSVGKIIFEKSQKLNKGQVLKING